MSDATPSERERRKFLHRLAGAVSALVVGSAWLRWVRRASAGTAATEAGLNESPLARMHADLRRALTKPVEQRSWAMVIDTRKCIGCNACAVACMAENVAPQGVSFRTVPEIEVGEYPEVTRVFMPTNCMQCEDPPCRKAAPPGAIYKRPDGIVVIDHSKFRGRKAFEAAAQACPYKALYFDEGKPHTSGTPAVQPYEKRASYDYGSPRQPGALANTGRKCHFCVHRLEAGLLPACVATCIGGAMHFGDLNDPESLVSRLRRQNRSMRINADAGTRPRVFYLADSFEEGPKACASCHSLG